jgi:hypothetical protein
MSVDVKTVLADFEVAISKGLTPQDTSRIADVAKVRLLGSIALSLEEIAKPKKKK